MLFKCWPSVFNAGPTLKQHCFNASCLLEWRVREADYPQVFMILCIYCPNCPRHLWSKRCSQRQAALLCKAKGSNCLLEKWAVTAFEHSATHSTQRRLSIRSPRGPFKSRFSAPPILLIRDKLASGKLRSFLAFYVQNGLSFWRSSDCLLQMILKYIFSPGCVYI